MNNKAFNFWKLRKISRRSYNSFLEKAHFRRIFDGLVETAYFEKEEIRIKVP